MAKKKSPSANEDTSISKSKAKREQRKKEVAKSKRQKRAARAAGIGAAAAVVLLIAAAFGKNIYLAAIRTTSSDDRGAGLTASGMIEGVDAASALELCDYRNITIPAEEVAASAEEVEDDISAALASHKELLTDPALKIADGDEVNIDYVGTVDGVEFEGGNSNGLGYDVTIGSGRLVDDFEQQLIGHGPGEQLTVEVTFPEGYGNAGISGKDARFAVTINGINVVPELTDAFVAENFAEEGLTTAAQYRASIENHYHEQHLRDFLSTYIIENSTVKSYPSAYLKAVRALTKYDDETMMAFLASYGGGSYEHVWDMRQNEGITNELDYEKDLKDRAKETVKTALVYQAIFEDAGLSLDMDEVFAEMAGQYGEDYVADMKETQGEASMAQTQIKNVVMDYLVGLYSTPTE